MIIRNFKNTHIFFLSGAHISEENTDGFPGESVLKPKYMCFSYTTGNQSSSGSSEDLPALVKSKKALKRKGGKHRSPSKKPCFGDEIIEISDSSPEKSPRKVHSSSMKTAPVARKSLETVSHTQRNVTVRMFTFCLLLKKGLQ